MPTARSSSSAVVHHEWLVVAGGWREERRLSSVEVLNTDTKQWFAGPSTPIPWMGMKTAITCYFMGGAHGSTSEIYHVPLPALTSRLHSQDSTMNTRHGRQYLNSQIRILPTLSISGDLLSVGGVETSIYLYQPDTGECMGEGGSPANTTM